MSTSDLTPVVIDELKGLYSLSGSKRKVNDGYSPDTQNTAFKPGRVETRAGIYAVASGLTNSLLTLKEFILLDSTTRRVLTYHDGGGIKKDTGTYDFDSNVVGSDLVEAGQAATTRMTSTTLYGKEYIPLAVQGTQAYSLPWQYDDTNLDPYAPPGPAGAPSVVDGGAGNIAAGVHQLRVFFKTRTGYWTAPGPAVSWTAAGSLVGSVTAIPLGPAYVKARVVAATPTCSDDFYFIEGSGMVINDNTTTTATIDFTDATLIAGTPVSAPTTETADDQMRLVCLPEQSGVSSYRDRLCWFGGRRSFELNQDTGIRALRFSGGFSSNTPLGWTQKTAGQSKTTVTGGQGDCLLITGTGIGNQRGCLENNSQVNQVLPPGVSISARIRMRRSSAAVGHLYVYIGNSADSATTFPSSVLDVAINGSAASSEWRVISGEILSAANNTLTSSSRLRIAVGGKVANDGLANADTITIDYIELYETNHAYNLSQVWWSKPGDPESIDGLTGIQTISENDGDAIRHAFSLFNTFYFVKEHGTHATQDTGDEPDTWPVWEASRVVGTPSARGVGRGDEWVVIASRSGLQYFAGGGFTSISTPIRDTWNRINWLYGWRIWVTVDQDNNRINIGVPLDGATINTHVLSYMYRDTPLSDGDWSIWVSLANNGSFDDSILSFRSDGSRVQLYSGGTAAFKYDTTKHVDNDGSDRAISSYYVTKALRSDPRRNKLGYVTGWLEGSGSVTLTGLGPDFSTATNMGSGTMTLASNPNTEFEKLVDINSNTIALKFAVNSAASSGAWFGLEHLIAWIRMQPGVPTRGSTP